MPDNFIFIPGVSILFVYDKFIDPHRGCRFTQGD